jgi:hypothetical protein
MKSLSKMGLMTVLASTLAHAEVPAGYFRVWEGFQRADLSKGEFQAAIPSFMQDTVELYGGERALSNYIVVLPPKKKPSFIPDELALVALTSEADYRRIRETAKGKAYGARHWDVFDRDTSRSAP